MREDYEKYTPVKTWYNWDDEAYDRARLVAHRRKGLGILNQFYYPNTHSTDLIVGAFPKEGRHRGLGYERAIRSIRENWASMHVSLLPSSSPIPEAAYSGYHRVQFP